MHSLLSRHFKKMSLPFPWGLMSPYYRDISRKCLCRFWGTKVPLLSRHFKKMSLPAFRRLTSTCYYFLQYLLYLFFSGKYMNKSVKYHIILCYKNPNLTKNPVIRFGLYFYNLFFISSITISRALILAYFLSFDSTTCHGANTVLVFAIISSIAPSY